MESTLKERSVEFNNDIINLLKKYKLFNEGSVIYGGTINFGFNKFPEINLTLSIE